MSISKIFIQNSLCVFSQIKDKNILIKIFILLPGSCPGWDLWVLGGVKNFSVGICDGAPSTARSSKYLGLSCSYNNHRFCRVDNKIGALFNDSNICYHGIINEQSH